MARWTWTPARRAGATRDGAGASPRPRTGCASSAMRTCSGSIPRAPDEFTGWSAAAPTSPTPASTGERPEELLDLRGERRRLLERGEVAALLHARPALETRVGLGRQRARRTQDLLRELGVAGRNVDGPSVRDRPALLHARVIR